MTKERLEAAIEAAAATTTTHSQAPSVRLGGFKDMGEDDRHALLYASAFVSNGVRYEMLVHHEIYDQGMIRVFTPQPPAADDHIVLVLYGRHGKIGNIIMYNGEAMRLARVGPGAYEQDYELERNGLVKHLPNGVRILHTHQPDNCESFAFDPESGCVTPRASVFAPPLATARYLVVSGQLWTRTRFEPAMRYAEYASGAHVAELRMDADAWRWAPKVLSPDSK